MHTKSVLRWTALLICGEYPKGSRQLSAEGGGRGSYSHTEGRTWCLVKRRERTAQRTVIRGTGNRGQEKHWLVEMCK